MATGVASTLYYWRNQRGGPKLARLVFDDADTREVNLADHASFEAARQTWDRAIGVVLQAPATGRWTGHYYDAQRRWCWTGGDRPAWQDAVLAVLRERHLSVAEHEARLADPALNLEHHLKTHDWYYTYSDDHRAWSGGEWNIKEIRRLMQLVPVETSRRLWAQYAPQDIPYPD